MLFLIDVFIFQRLRGKGLNLFFNQSLLNGLLHFQKCLQRINILGGKKIDHMLSEEKSKSIVAATQYMKTLLYPVISRNKDPVAGSFIYIDVYIDSCSLLTYF